MSQKKNVLILSLILNQCHIYVFSFIFKVLIFLRFMYFSIIISMRIYEYLNPIFLYL